MFLVLIPGGKRHNKSTGISQPQSSDTEEGTGFLVQIGCKQGGQDRFYRFPRPVFPSLVDTIDAAVLPGKDKQ